MKAGDLVRLGAGRHGGIFFYPDRTAFAVVEIELRRADVYFVVETFKVPSRFGGMLEMCGVLHKNQLLFVEEEFLEILK